MSANLKVGRKILQYCLENFDGRAFTCFDLTSQATRKGFSKSNIPFEAKEDDGIDQGFGHILREAARSPSFGGKPKSFPPRIPESLAGRPPWSVRP